MQKHLNKIRWVSLSVIFFMLILLPILSLYQNFVAAHATYNHLSSSEKILFDLMNMLTSLFMSNPEEQLDLIKGTTWSGQIFGIKVSDPLAVLSQMAAGKEFYWPFILTACIPVILSILLGRFFCGWICPATLLYELNSNIGFLLNKLGFNVGNKKFDKRIKYLVLIICLIASTYTGSVVVANIYPPAVIGREIYFSIALAGFSLGTLFILFTLAFDLLISRRAFCRYLCPGGALYSLLGRYRVLRVKREVTTCSDCGKCNSVCEFALNPMRDDVGQECNNCSACIAQCPTESITFTLSFSDAKDQGSGHLSKQYRQKVE